MNEHVDSNNKLTAKIRREKSVSVEKYFEKNPCTADSCPNWVADPCVTLT